MRPDEISIVEHGKELAQAQPVATSAACLQTNTCGAHSETLVAYPNLTVRDLVNYLVWMGEPAANARKKIGVVVLYFLGVLFVLAYAMKREFWKDVH